MTTQAHVNGRERVAARAGGGTKLRTAILAGLLGSVLFGMWMMVEGAFDRGFFAAPTSIWAFWAGPSAYHPGDLAVVPLVLGLAGHMMNSVIIGAVLLSLGTFGARGAIPTLAVTMAKGLAVMAIVFVAILPLSPNGQLVSGAAPLWSWAVGHLMYALGLWLVAWRRGRFA